MPRRCIAAGCNTKDIVSTRFLATNGLELLSATGTARLSTPCSAQSISSRIALRQRDHAIETRLHGIPAKKRLKPDAVPTIFPLSIHGGSIVVGQKPLLQDWQHRNDNVKR